LSGSVACRGARGRTVEHGGDRSDGSGYPGYLTPGGESLIALVAVVLGGGTVKLARHAGREAARGRVAALGARAQATTVVPVTACQVWKRAALVWR